MIVRGDFVFDWMGRPGIAMEKTSPAEEAELDPILDWPLKGLPEKTTWWLVALCEGGIVKSPELRTQSLGKVSEQVLKITRRHHAAEIRGGVTAFLKPERSHETSSRGKTV